MATVRVMVVDDHTLVRKGLVALLGATPDIAVVAEACDGYQALEVARTVPLDAVLLDVRMPRCSGGEAVRLLRRELPHLAVLMLTVSERDEDLFEAVKHGARGYLLKTAEPSVLLQAIRQVAAGEVVFSPPMTAKLAAGFARLASGCEGNGSGGYDALTEREREVLRLLARGARNKEIAQALCVCEHTVRAHLRNITAKLSVHNRTQLAAYAVREGLVEEADLGEPLARSA